MLLHTSDNSKGPFKDISWKKKKKREREREGERER